MSTVTVTLLTERLTPAGATRLTVCVNSPMMPPIGMATVLMVKNELSRSCGAVAMTVSGVYTKSTR